MFLYCQSLQLSSAMKYLSYILLLVAGMFWTACKPPVTYISDMRAYPVQLTEGDSITFEWKYTPHTLPADAKVYVQVAGSAKGLMNDEFIFQTLTSSIYQNKIRVELGDRLTPGEKYYWNLAIESEGQQSTSPLESFYAAKPYPNAWKGTWISYPEEQAGALPVFRKQFEIAFGRIPDQATIFVCAPGFCEIQMNGQVVTDEVLSPPQTNFEYYALYQVFELGRSYFKSGTNTIDVYLGEGWYAQDSVWNKNQKYGAPCLLFDMKLQAGAATEYLGSDTGWKWANGPWVQSNIYAGDVYDARIDEKIMADEVEWKPVTAATAHPPKVYAQAMEPIRVVGELPAKSVTQVDDSTYVIDFGQNFTGWVKMQVDEPSGTYIRLKLAEEIDSSGYVDTESTGVFATKVEQQDAFISAGKKASWSPRFTYHGFRFAEVSGLSHPPTISDFTGQVLQTDMSLAGGFICSDNQINKLHELNVWTLRSNVLGVPLDCPHREKCGWTGDAHSIAPALLYNYDAGLFMNKYLHDVHSIAQLSRREIHFLSHFKDRVIDVKPAGIPYMSAPGKRRNGVASPEWGSIVVQLPWYLFQFSSDTLYLEQNLNAMITWVDYIRSKAIDNIVPIGLGDWCPPGGNAYMQCPIPLSSTAFYYLDLSLLLRIAGILGRDDISARYAPVANSVRNAFQEHFYISDSLAFGSQTANILAIRFGLADEALTRNAARALVDNVHQYGFLNTGIFGLKYIFEVLCENGYEADAYELLTKKGYNSFAYMWEHYGATTMWEVLPIDDYYDNAQKNDHKRSHNHPMQASFDAFFFTHIAGIHPPTNPNGNTSLEMKPYFTRFLSQARASYRNRFGIIYSEWQSSPDVFTWKINLPQGQQAQLFVPVLPGSSPKISINNQPVVFSLNADVDGQWAVFNNISGNQTVKVTY